MAQVTINKVTRVTRHFIEHEGQQVEVKKNSTIDHYGKDVLVFVNKLKKGDKAGTPEFWVSVKDFKPSKREGAQSKIAKVKELALKGEKLTVEQVLAMLEG